MDTTNKSTLKVINEEELFHKIGIIMIENCYIILDKRCIIVDYVYKAQSEKKFPC